MRRSRVGVGLIGGSLAAALKQRGLVKQVIGVGRDARRLAAAQHAGLIDQGEVDLATAARKAQLVVVCTPVDRIVDDVRQAAKSMQPGSLITDAGSVKGVICQSLADFPLFIGSHPLAGSEKQGFEHSSARLYDQRMCVITPLPNSPRDQVKRLHAFWQAVGMQTCELSPEEHDAALARTSHLPHAAAAALTMSLHEAAHQFAATGFRDTTRIAAGDPALWTAIFQQNSPALIDAISHFESEMSFLKSALQHGDRTALKNWLAQAKTKRDALDQPFPAQ